MALGEREAARDTESAYVSTVHALLCATAARTRAGAGTGPGLHRAGRAAGGPPARRGVRTRAGRPAGRAAARRGGRPDGGVRRRPAADDHRCRARDAAQSRPALARAAGAWSGEQGHGRGRGAGGGRGPGGGRGGARALRHRWPRASSTSSTRDARGAGSKAHWRRSSAPRRCSTRRSVRRRPGAQAPPRPGTVGALELPAANGALAGPACQAYRQALAAFAGACADHHAGRAHRVAGRAAGWLHRRLRGPQARAQRGRLRRLGAGGARPARAAITARGEAGRSASSC